MAYILIVDTRLNFATSLFGGLNEPGTATAVATVSEATGLFQTDVPDLLASDVILADGSSASLVQQAEAAGVRTLMMTGNPDRIIDFDATGQPYLSKPCPPDLFLQRVREILAERWPTDDKPLDGDRGYQRSGDRD